MPAADAIAVAVIVALAGAAQSLTGFGFSLLAVPLLAVVVGPEAAVLTANALGSAVNVALVVEGWAHVRRRTAAVLLAGAVAGLPIGLLVIEVLDPQALKVVIAVVVLVLTGLLARGVTLGARGLGVDLATGFTSGVLSTSTSMNGPPLVLGLQAQGFGPAEFRATLATVFVVSGVLSVLLLTAAGNWTDTVTLALVAGIPGLAVGWWLGRLAYRRVDPVRFRAVVLGMLVASALVALASVVFG